MSKRFFSFNGNTLLWFQPSCVCTQQKPTINSRRTHTICQAGTALRHQDEGGGGHNLSAQPMPPCALLVSSEQWLPPPPQILLGPPEIPMTTRQALLQLKVSRRLSFRLTANRGFVSVRGVEAGVSLQVRGAALQMKLEDKRSQI